MGRDEDIELPPDFNPTPDLGTSGEPEPEKLFVRRDWDETPTEELNEPGGAIPDLPVWEEPDTSFASIHQLARNEPIRLVPRVSEQPAAWPSPSLTLRASVSLVECTKLRAQLAIEWRSMGLVPTVDDVVLRAAARAFREVWGSEARVGLRRIDGGSEQIALAPDADAPSFRDAVAGLAGSPREDGGADLVVTSFLGTGVGQADPRLDSGYFALTIGAEQNSVALGQFGAVDNPVMTLSLAYAPDSVPDNVAAALLSRVRELVEAPYALLAD